MTNYFWQDYKGCLKKFREVDLGGLQKQANSILKECDPEDQDKLSSLIKGDKCKLV